MLPKQLIVTLPNNKQILYPSLSEFCRSFKANQSAVLTAMKNDRPYKGITLRYVDSTDLVNTNTKYWLGNLVGYEIRIAELSDNDELIKRIFSLVVQQKKLIAPRYRNLLAELQCALNFLNVGEINI